MFDIWDIQFWKQFHSFNNIFRSAILRIWREYRIAEKERIIGHTVNYNLSRIIVIFENSVKSCADIDILVVLLNLWVSHSERQKTYCKVCFKSWRPTWVPFLNKCHCAQNFTIYQRIPCLDYERLEANNM